MTYRMAFLSAAAACIAALPHAAAAADYYDEGGPRPSRAVPAAETPSWSGSTGARPSAPPTAAVPARSSSTRATPTGSGLGTLRGWRPRARGRRPGPVRRPGLRRGALCRPGGRLWLAGPPHAGLPTRGGAARGRCLRRPGRTARCRLHDRAGRIGHARRLAQDRDPPHLLPALTRRAGGVQSRLRNPAKVMSPSGQGPWPESTLMCPALPASTKAEPQTADSVADSSMVA